jgi:hypothetical protein
MLYNVVNTVLNSKERIIINYRNYEDAFVFEEIHSPIIKIMYTVETRKVVGNNYISNDSELPLNIYNLNNDLQKIIKLCKKTNDYDKKEMYLDKYQQKLKLGLKLYNNFVQDECLRLNKVLKKLKNVSLLVLHFHFERYLSDLELPEGLACILLTDSLNKKNKWIHLKNVIEFTMKK